MEERTSGERSIGAGRDMKIVAAASGDKSIAIASSSETTVCGAPSIDAKAELAVLRQILSTLEDLDRKALTRLDEAAEEAAKPKPDHGEVQNLIEQATRYAKTANGFADQAGKLVPHLTRVAVWLGRAWSDWGPTLGL
jgi:hypothetical protein